MATETPSVAPPRAEVPMVDAEVVRQIRELHRGGWGAKRIARELEVARNTVRRYLRLRTVEAGIQIRPRARQLDAPARAEALRLFDGPAEHNAVVVTQLLRERGVASRRGRSRRGSDRCSGLSVVRGRLRGLSWGNRPHFGADQPRRPQPRRSMRWADGVALRTRCPQGQADPRAAIAGGASGVTMARAGPHPRRARHSGLRALFGSFCGPRPSERLVMG